MRYLFISLILLLSYSGAKGHPSWGIAVSSKGEIYFADVMHGGIGTIWKISQKGIVFKLLEDFHAHNLAFNKDGNLWIAENRYITGEIEGEGQHKLLIISPDGNKEEIIFTDDIDNFNGNDFAIGNTENVIFHIHNHVYNRPFNGEPELLIQHNFKRIATIYSDPTGNLWITDKNHKGGTLFKWNKTECLQEYSTRLIAEKHEDPIFQESRYHLMFGIKRTAKGDVFVADNAGRKIQRIDSTGRKYDFYKSEKFWYPAGIDFYKGDAYIVEVGYNKRHLGSRIIKLDSEKKVTELFNYGTFIENY